MNTAIKHINPSRFSIKANPLLWCTWILYILIAGYTIFHHEPWGDELHSWTISRGSTSFFNLIHNIRYEGHPPVWYIVLWTLSKFTHNLMYMQLVHIMVAILAVFVLLFYAPFPTLTKILIPFGYYFLYEYAALSRNYIIGILAALLLCVLYKKEFKYKTVIYYLLLLIMSNTHLLAMLLAGSIHLYFLLALKEKQESRTVIIRHIVFGILIFLPAIYFILPPFDSELGVGASLGRWSGSQLAIDIQTPFRAFLPMPAWWEYHFWNQEFLLSLHSRFGFLKIVYPLMAFFFVGLGCYLLGGNKKSVVLFLANIGVTYIVGNVYSLATQRYSGFIFIAFLIAYWLHCYEKPVSQQKTKIINILLAIQLISGIFIVSRDIKLPFSNAYRVTELVREVPLNEKLTTDYWGLIAVSAYTDKPVYCIDMERAASFNQWQMSMTTMRLYPYRYCKGLYNLFKKEGIHSVYFISPDNPQRLSTVDTKLFSSFKVQLIDKREGAIEKDSDLYLYRISDL
jgi:hypothetical protein